MSPRAKILGAIALTVVFVGLEALDLGYCGFNPRSFAGVEIGALIGLASLALEIQIVERAFRQPKGDTASATFQTFAMRLALVAPLTLAFQRSGSSVDSTAFAVAYLVTFFMYLCWLTWTTYHTPIQYKARPKQFAPRVVDKRRPTDAVGSAR